MARLSSARQRELLAIAQSPERKITLLRFAYDGKRRRVLDSLVRLGLATMFADGVYGFSYALTDAGRATAEEQGT